ncbi:MAG: DnaA/Hda family protein, partial [Planctomycetota bacterium]
MSQFATDTTNAFSLESPLLRQRTRDARLARERMEASLPFFVAGDENRLVACVCQSETVVELAQPLLIIGPQGCGKTTIALHLAAKLARGLDRAGDLSAIRYYTASDFAREYADSVAADDIEHFREAIDEAPVLVVDDIQVLAGKSAAQDELAMRLDRRISLGMRTILTSKRLPSETRGVRPQLASRTVMGLTVPIRLPTSETRRALLKELALFRGVEISEELVGLLESGLRSDLSVLGLDASIKQLDLYCRMNQTGVDITAIQMAIDTTGTNESIDLGKITRTVARIWGHRTKELRSGSRKQSVVRARSLAMFLARQMTPLSLDKIGEYFGGRDHSTVLHAI